MVGLQNTKGICSKMIFDIRRIAFWTNIIVQSIFFIFYGYSIFDNVKNITLLVIYSILLIIAIMGFITYFITHIKKIKNPKRFTRTLRVLKYVANGTMIAFSIYELIKFGMGDFSKILLIISIMSLSKIALIPCPILLAPALIAFKTSLASPFSPACMVKGIFFS